jgi:hypothetical protein
MSLLGADSVFNFMTQALSLVFLNNALRIYGEASVYGSEVTLAVASGNPADLVWMKRCSGGRADCRFCYGSSCADAVCVRNESIKTYGASCIV